MNRNQRNLVFILVWNSSPVWFTLAKPLNPQASEDDTMNVPKTKQKIHMNQQNASRFCFLPITDCMMSFFIFQETLVPFVPFILIEPQSCPLPSPSEISLYSAEMLRPSILGDGLLTLFCWLLLTILIVSFSLKPNFVCY